MKPTDEEISVSQARAGDDDEIDMKAIESSSLLSFSRDSLASTPAVHCDIPDSSSTALVPYDPLQNQNSNANLDGKIMSFVYCIF